jgi:hypothetical protein
LQAHRAPTVRMETTALRVLLDHKGRLVHKATKDKRDLKVLMAKLGLKDNLAPKEITVPLGLKAPPVLTATTARLATRVLPALLGHKVIKASKA